MTENLSPQTRAERAAEAERLKEEAAKQAVGAYGTARFLRDNEFENLGLYEGPIILGRSQENRLIRYGGDSHLCTIAPNGTGKSVASVVVNTLEYPGSLCVIDPKGAIAPICARARLQRGKVWIFDPFHAVKDPALQSHRISFNPLDFLDPDSPDLIDDVRLISESLVIGEDDKNAFFSDTARTVLECLILYVLANCPPEARTIESVIELAYFDPTRFKEEVIPVMQASEAFSGILAQMANQIAGFAGDAGGSVWMTLRRSLNFLQSPRMTSALRPSNVVDFRRMKDEVITVFLVLPATRLTRYGRWLRLMVSIMIAALLDPRKPPHPVLFLIDEASALGNLAVLSDGIALFRGYHLKLWLYWQSLDQMEAAYPHHWQTFLANSIKQVFGVNDSHTAEYFSKYMGNMTRQVMSNTVDTDKQAGNANISHIQRPLQTLDEIMRLRADFEYLLLERQFPMWARKIKYYADEEFQGKFDPDPYIAG